MTREEALVQKYETELKNVEVKLLLATNEDRAHLQSEAKRISERLATHQRRVAAEAAKGGKP